ncbi:hypothetical protein ARC20_05425 [Stenotrophomonas panacihumi]|uniref:Uncharacterized protein n=1 Tax=Stenotrophomonas panacihumi TaxID=676599 RepID=A0A0R0AME0_9GAMM|nr:hypothetical protein [Stenotrophomonas panacihumi]KRG46438.1 hypothetical protein ARC20_05425 [Stenotrophomonas panacihumi]PTN55144.1 hypothetical protein C9J98_08080 [Stenotrophomonas panacihumi]
MLLSALLLLASGDACAQAKQTAQGAQTFLIGITQGGGQAGIFPRYAVLGQSNFNGAPGMLNAWLKSMDSLNEAGNPDPCVTRLLEIDSRAPGVWAQGIRWSITAPGVGYSAPITAFPMPRYIHWGKASIARVVYSYDESGTDRTEYIVARYMRPGEKTADALVIGASDSGMVDRIEYAMKFLQASCDTSVSTGF